MEKQYLALGSRISKNSDRSDSDPKTEEFSLKLLVNNLISKNKFLIAPQLEEQNNGIITIHWGGQGILKSIESVVPRIRNDLYKIDYSIEGLFPDCYVDGRLIQEHKGKLNVVRKIQKTTPYQSKPLKSEELKRKDNEPYLLW